MAASYFDVDGTLVSSNLIHPTLYYMLNHQTPLRSLQKLGTALLRAPAMALAELRDRRTFNELLFASYEDFSEDRLIELSFEAYEKVMKPKLYPGARSLVKHSLDIGHHVVLISGALDIVLSHLAKEIGATHIIGNRLEMHNGYATGKLLRPVVAGPTKARLITDHAKQNGHDLDDCYAYSDSYSDVPMLSVVGHPAAVNPDKQLTYLAKSYHWPIIDLSVKK
jgi:HAD superfamily hydrolase (TIGR01490 family)